MEGDDMAIEKQEAAIEKETGRIESFSDGVFAVAMWIFWAFAFYERKPHRKAREQDAETTGLHDLVK